MNEAERHQRNAEKLGECFPAFAVRMRRVLDRMEARGFRPRIQDAWRSIPDQLAAFNAGHSKIKFGFHNVTGADNAREALACDVLDEDSPLSSRRRYLLALTLAARAEGLDTGLLWELDDAQEAAVEAALARGDIDASVAIGFDPTHVQVTGLTIAEAKVGRRPTAPGDTDATLLPTHFTYIFNGTEDWIWLGAERIHTRCGVATVLEGLKSAGQLTSLGRQDQGFHQVLLGLSTSAGFTA